MAEVSENSPIDAASAMSLGKRHLLVRDYNGAVNTLVQACTLMVKEHGDGADELAEPYLLYGRALLGLAREESNVLGAGVPGSKDSDEDDDGEECDEEEGDEDEKDDKSDKDASEGKSKDAEKEGEKESSEKKDKNEVTKEIEKNDAAKKENEVAEKAAGSSKEVDASSENKKEESNQSEEKNKTEGQKPDETKQETKASDESTPKVADKSEESKETNKTEAMNATDDEKIEESKKNEVPKDEAIPGSSKMTNGESSSAAENGGAVENEEEDDDEVDNLEVAWEVLELAKLTILKRGPPGWKLLSETHKLLGEVAMEGGNATRAVTDFQACLDLLQKIDPCEPRAIAEIYYQLGLAFSFMNDFDSSIEKFQEASSILEARIKELEQTTEPPKCDDPFYSVEGEIKELKELLPEIGEKISDMKDAKQEACKRIIEDIRERTAAGSCSNGASTSTSAINGGASSSGSSSGPSKKSVNDISHLIRKKRKPEEDLADESVPSKKSLQ